MDTGKTRELRTRLEGLRRRFERLRQTRKARSRIPDELWAAAAKMAGTCGIHRTSKTLAAHQLQVLLSAGNPEATQAVPAWRSVGPAA